MKKHPTPVHHGNWRVINGELVDMDQVPAAPTTTQETPADAEKQGEDSPPISRPRRRGQTSED